MAMEPPRIFPTFRTADPAAVIAWLTDVVGFTERVVHRGKDGAIAHAELAYGSSLVMLGGERDDEYGAMIGGKRRTDAIYVAVDDTDALYEKVKASGVAVEREIFDTDYGSRDFACRDPDGNLWSFGTYWPKAGEDPSTPQ